jgi:hypothetical protein
MEQEVRQLFERYEEVFKGGLRGELEPQAAAQLYASECIAASPAGVSTAKNDAQLLEVMAQGYERYRSSGMKNMRMRELRIAPIDGQHCLAHVAWTATYARKQQPDVDIDFEVHYFIQKLKAEAKVFGWVAGDEQAVLKKHGIIQERGQ